MIITRKWLNTNLAFRICCLSSGHLKFLIIIMGISIFLIGSNAYLRTIFIVKHSSRQCVPVIYTHFLSIYLSLYSFAFLFVQLIFCNVNHLHKYKYSGYSKKKKSFFTFSCSTKKCKHEHRQNVREHESGLVDKSSTKFHTNE